MPKKRNFFNYLILFICCFLVTGESFGQEKYWVSASTSNWNNAANWASASGAGGGAGVPLVGDTVIFDANGLGRCNIDISIDVRAIIVQAGFTDSIVQQSGNTINIGPRRAIFNGGTFVGGDSRIRFEDPFIIDGTTFISTTDTLLPTETVTLTSGSFDANNGTTVMRFSSTFSGDLSFHKLVFDPTGNRTYVITAGDTVDVQDSLIYTNSNRVRLNTGVLNVPGDIF